MPHIIESSQTYTKVFRIKGCSTNSEGVVVLERTPVLALFSNRPNTPMWACLTRSASLLLYTYF